MNIPKMIRSFIPASKGIKQAFLSENNMKIHFLAALIALALGFFLHITKNDWLWIVVAITLVMITELFNTAIENLVNLVSPEFNAVAGKIKDFSAGSVLVAAIAAVLIGLMIFIPHM